MALQLLPYKKTKQARATATAYQYGRGVSNTVLFYLGIAIFMKQAQKNIILHRFAKLVLCGGFILTLSACGLKGPLYLPPENPSAQTPVPQEQISDTEQQENEEPSHL